MKKFYTLLFIIASGYSSLYPMMKKLEKKLATREEELAESKELIGKLTSLIAKGEIGIKKADKATKAKEIKALADQVQALEQQREAEQGEEVTKYLDEFRRYSKQQKASIREKSEEAVKLYLNNDSRWNAQVNLLRGDSTAALPTPKEVDRKQLDILKLAHKGEPHHQITLDSVDDIVYLDIIPDNEYWAKPENFKRLVLTNLAEKVKRLHKQHPSKSIQLTITIPKTKGYVFTGFAADLELIEIKPFTMTLEEYSEKRRAGEIKAPKEKKQKKRDNVALIKKIKEADITPEQEAQMLLKIVEQEELTPVETALLEKKKPRMTSEEIVSQITGTSLSNKDKQLLLQKEVDTNKKKEEMQQALTVIITESTLKPALKQRLLDKILEQNFAFTDEEWQLLVRAHAFQPSGRNRKGTIG